MKIINCILIMFVVLSGSLVTAQDSKEEAKVKIERKGVKLKEIENITREPALKLHEALAIVVAHFKEERIDVSDHFLKSVRLIEVKAKKGRRWELTWIPKEYSMGGEIWVNLSMDRRLKPNIEYGR